MAVLYNVSVIFCVFLCWSDSYCLPFENDEIEDVNNFKIASPALLDLCQNYGRLYATSRKIICIICKGLDPSCFIKSTTTTTSSTTTSSTTQPTTTTTTVTTTTAAADSEK